MLSGTVCATVSQTSEKFQSPAIGLFLCRIILYLEIVLNTEFNQAIMGNVRMPKGGMQSLVVSFGGASQAGRPASFSLSAS
jgi:hypothetical protein